MTFIKEDTKSKRYAWKYKLIQTPITLTCDIKKVKLQKQIDPNTDAEATHHSFAWRQYIW
jgi:hypothetical protein